MINDFSNSCQPPVAGFETVAISTIGAGKMVNSIIGLVHEAGVRVQHTLGKIPGTHFHYLLQISLEVELGKCVVRQAIY